MLISWAVISRSSFFFCGFHWSQLNLSGTLRLRNVKAGQFCKQCAMWAVHSALAAVCRGNSGCLDCTPGRCGYESARPYLPSAFSGGVTSRATSRADNKHVVSGDGRSSTGGAPIQSLFHIPRMTHGRIGYGCFLNLYREAVSSDVPSFPHSSVPLSPPPPCAQPFQPLCRF